MRVNMGIHLNLQRIQMHHLIIVGYLIVPMLLLLLVLSYLHLQLHCFALVADAAVVPLKLYDPRIGRWTAGCSRSGFWNVGFPLHRH